MVVSGQVEQVWPNRGNSFWVTHAGGRWHIFTWSPIGYQVPAATNMAALCRACMAHGESAMPKVPQSLVQQSGLLKQSDEEADQIYGEMDSPG
jgi:hypothetical protein